MSARDKEVENILSSQEHYLVYLLAHLNTQDYPGNSEIQKLPENALGILKLFEKNSRYPQCRVVFNELLKTIQNIPTIFWATEVKEKNQNAFVEAAAALRDKEYDPLIKHLAEHLRTADVYNEDPDFYKDYGVCLVSQLDEKNQEQIKQQFKVGRKGIVLTKDNTVCFVEDGEFLGYENDDLRYVKVRDREAMPMIEDTCPIFVQPPHVFSSDSGSVLGHILIEAFAKDGYLSLPEVLPTAPDMPAAVEQPAPVLQMDIQPGQEKGKEEEKSEEKAEEKQVTLSDQENYLLLLLAHLRIEAYPKSSKIRKLPSKALALLANKDWADQSRRQAFDELLKAIDNISTVFEFFRTPIGENHNAFVQAAKALKHEGYAPLIQHLASHLAPITVHNTDKITYQVVPASQFNPHDPFQIEDHSQRENIQRAKNQTKREFDGVAAYTTVNSESMARVKIGEFETKLSKKMDPVLVRFFMNNFHQDSLCDLLDRRGILGQFFWQHYGELFFDANVEKRGPDRYYDIEASQKEFVLTVKVVGRVGRCNDEPINVSLEMPVLLEAEMKFVFRLNDKNEIDATRESFTCSAAPSFYIYDMCVVEALNENDPDQCRKIAEQFRIKLGKRFIEKGRSGIVLTNENKAYFIVNGKFVLNPDGTLQCVEKIDRGPFNPVKKGAVPATMEFGAISKSVRKQELHAVIIEALAKGGHLHFRIPPSDWFTGEAREVALRQALEQELAEYELCKEKYENFIRLQVFLQSNNESAEILPELIDCLKAVDEAISQDRLPNEAQVLSDQKSPQLEKLEPAKLIELRKKKCAALTEKAKLRANEAREQYEKIITELNEFRKLIENKEKAESESPKENGKEEADRNSGDKGKGKEKREEDDGFDIVLEGDFPETASPNKILAKGRLSISEMRSRFLAASGAKASGENGYISKSRQWVPPKAQKRRQKDVQACCEEACSDWREGKVLYGKNVAPKSDEEKVEDIEVWFAHVQTELGLTRAQVEGLALTLSQELYDLHEGLVARRELELSTMSVLISRPDEKKKNIKIELVSKIDDSPLFETRFVLSVDELTNKKGQPKVAPISVFGTHEYIPQTFAEAVEAVQIRSYPGRMEKLHQVEAFLGQSLLKIADHKEPGDPSLELGRRLACEGEYKGQLFLVDGVKKEGWEQAFNESFGSVGTKEMPAVDVLKASYDQSIANLPQRMGWTLAGHMGRLKGVQVARVPERSRGDSSCNSNLSAGGPGILKVTGVSSSGFELIWSPALELDSDIDNNPSQIIPGEIFVTATKTVDGGVVESISYSNLLLRGLYEYAPIEEDGEFFYPQLKVYGYTVVNEGGTINAEGLDLASDRAQEEEDIARDHLALARKGFSTYSIESKKLSNILNLVEAHLISNTLAYPDVATLSTAMATAIYRDLPLVLSDKKELEDCPLLLKTIVWCGVPELRQTMYQVLKPREEAEQDKGESEAAAASVEREIEPALSAVAGVRRKGLDDLLAIYGSGDVADHAQAYKDAGKPYKKAAGRRWVNSAVANLERLKAEEAKAALKCQRSEESLRDQIYGEIEDNIAAIREQEKQERFKLTTQIEKARKSSQELKGRAISEPDQIEIGEAGSSSPRPDTVDRADAKKKEEHMSKLEEQLRGLDNKFDNLTRIQESRDPETEAREIIEQSKLEAARAQERVAAATQAVEIAASAVLKDFYSQRPNRLPVKLKLESCTLLPRIQKNKDGDLEDNGFDVVVVASGLWVTVSDSEKSQEVFIPGKIVLKTRTAVGKEAESASFDIGVHHEFVDIITPNELLKKLLKYDTHSRDPELTVKIDGETISIIDSKDRSRQLKKDGLEKASQMLEDKEIQAQEKLAQVRAAFKAYVEFCRPIAGLLEDPSSNPKVIQYSQLVAVQALIAHNNTLDTETATIIYHHLRALLSSEDDEGKEALFNELFDLIHSSPQSVCFTHEFQAKMLRQVLESAYVQRNETLRRKVRRACVDHFFCTEQGRELGKLVENEIRPNITALKTQGEDIPGIDPDEIDDKVNQEVIQYMDCIDRCTNRNLNENLPEVLFERVTEEAHWQELENACHKQDISSDAKKWISRILMGVGIIAGVGLLIGLGLATAGVGPAVIGAVVGTVFAPSIPTLAASAFAIVGLGVGKLVGWSGDKDVSRTEHVKAACEGMDKLLTEATQRAEAERQKVLASVPIEREEEEVYGGEGCRGGIPPAAVSEANREAVDVGFSEGEEVDPDEAQQEAVRRRALETNFDDLSATSETSEISETGEGVGFSDEEGFHSDDESQKKAEQETLKFALQQQVAAANMHAPVSPPLSSPRGAYSDPDRSSEEGVPSPKTPLSLSSCSSVTELDLERSTINTQDGRASTPPKSPPRGPLSSSPKIPSLGVNLDSIASQNLFSFLPSPAKTAPSGINKEESEHQSIDERKKGKKLTFGSSDEE